MNTYTIARNARTSLYEIHKAGCAHTVARHMEVCGDVEAVSGNEAARNEAQNNDGCAYTTGPCVQRGGHLVHFKDESNGWTLTSIPRAVWGAEGPAEPRRHTVNSSEQVTCPKSGKGEAITATEECGGCGTHLTADNSDQYGVLTISKDLGRMLGL